MSDQIPNPPAFPVGSRPDFRGFQEGMTLRDYFAARAMEAYVSAASFNKDAWKMMEDARIKKPENAEEFIAMISYNMADAMLKERSCEKPRTGSRSGSTTDKEVAGEGWGQFPVPPELWIDVRFQRSCGEYEAYPRDLPKHKQEYVRKYVLAINPESEA